MAPKEKAKELVNTYFHIIDNAHPLTDIMISAKQCALIAVDETLRALHFNVWTNVEEIKYWKEVKQHIEQL
jgi:hypothetical protein